MNLMATGVLKAQTFATELSYAGLALVDRALKPVDDVLTVAGVLLVGPFARRVQTREFVTNLSVSLVSSLLSDRSESTALQNQAKRFA